MVFLLDLLFIVASYVIAVLLRFNFQIPPYYTQAFVHVLIVIMMVKPVVFLLSGLYRSLWRYASLTDAIEIFKTVSTASILTSIALVLTRQFNLFSLGIFIIDWGILFSLIAASRLVWRVYRENYVIPLSAATATPTLIIGAGDAGNLLLREIRQQNEPEYQIIGFLDDDKGKQGMRINGVPVLGTTYDLSTVVKEKGIGKAIIAMPSATRAEMRNIIRRCEMARVLFKTLPRITDLINGTITISQIKDVEIEDLLGRDTVVLDDAGIREYLTDKVVLVTGAAGSIGSELCRQIANFRPIKLIIFDNAETPLFLMDRELSSTFPEQRLLTIIGDIRNRDRLEWLFAEFKPEVVFHAAAYKHVPMMEYNPSEAVINNILGTRNLVDVSCESGVTNFVMVSTDKAVNPTNVMGATKRAAERYVQAVAGRCATRFTTVRFGNVLGSNGSVVPLFKEQIRNGGPLTITDPEMNRFFMTISEASQLVLQAGCLGNSGEIFVLDMGEAVRILDLAEELIRLSGFIPYEDIDIVCIGLRPGEKLYEETLIAGKEVAPTRHEKIKVLTVLPTEDLDELTSELAILQGLAIKKDIPGLMEALKRVVPEFTPRYQFKGPPPYAFKRLRPELFPGLQQND